jgi:hypothetical protein
MPGSPSRPTVSLIICTRNGLPSDRPRSTRPAATVDLPAAAHSPVHVPVPWALPRAGRMIGQRRPWWQACNPTV